MMMLNMFCFQLSRHFSTVPGELLFTIPGTLVRATVVKRPSKLIASPYVADIRLEDGSMALCHTPGLGCSGLVEIGRVIHVVRNKEGLKTAFTAHLAECHDKSGLYFAGIHPLISQAVASKLLSSVSDVALWKQEVTVEKGSRLDYCGLLPNGKKIYVEIKNAMVSKEPDTPRASRRAIFPEGYRKVKSDSFSPRAVKHVKTLATLLRQQDTEACVLLFIIPRSDCEGGLELNPKDPVYLAAVKNAFEEGVQVKAHALHFEGSGAVFCCGETSVHF